MLVFCVSGSYTLIYILPIVSSLGGIFSYLSSLGGIFSYLSYCCHWSLKKINIDICTSMCKSVGLSLGWNLSCFSSFPVARDINVNMSPCLESVTSPCRGSRGKIQFHQAFWLRFCIQKAIKKLEPGKAWEQGYMHGCMLTKV